ncbi:MAG: hypothetical protein RL088_4271 [Verrucomicrobiota bacterium]|jgi:cytochrome c553
MKPRILTFSLVGLSIACLAAELADPAKLPAAAKEYDFKTDVQEILETRCVRCHSGEKAEGELRLDTLSEAKAGGENFPTRAIVPENSEESSIIHLTARLVEELEMPPEDKGEPLSREEIGKLRAWIDAGAPWPEGLQLKARKPAKAKKPADTAKPETK